MLFPAFLCNKDAIVQIIACMSVSDSELKRLCRVTFSDSSKLQTSLYLKWQLWLCVQGQIVAKLKLFEVHIVWMWTCVSLWVDSNYPLLVWTCHYMTVHLQVRHITLSDDKFPLSSLISFLHIDCRQTEHFCACFVLKNFHGKKREEVDWVEIPQMSQWSIRNVMSDKLDGASHEYLSRKENTLQTGEKWSF